MQYTGTLIEDLFATVERVEAKAQIDARVEIEPWFAAVLENSQHDSNLIEVA